VIRFLNKRAIPELGFAEFISLTAMMMSLVALSVDSMLPALSAIGRDLGVIDNNSSQLIISLFFLGLASGQLLYGPVSDNTGRKAAIYVGYGLFITGCVLSLFATTLYVMLAGRFWTCNNKMDTSRSHSY
jgi:DHA1 family bicyclomycin/chloramphenicol resistance-like MFS transporter